MRAAPLPRTSALLIALAMAAGACGSTVQVAGGPVTDPAGVGAASGVPADGLSLPGGDRTSVGGGLPGASAPTAASGISAGPAAAGTTAPGGAVAGGAAGGVAGGPAGGGGPTGEAGGGAAGGPATQAPPGAATAEGAPILLGFPYLEGATNALNGLGTEVSFGDGRLQAEALVADLNRRGGINGRPVEGHYVGVDVGGDQETAFAAACSRLTEDIGVFAVLNTINPPESFVSCVAARDTPMFNVSFNAGDDGLYARFPDHFFSPTALSLDGQIGLVIDNLAAEGVLADPATTIGVLFFTGDPQLPRVVEQTIRPRLEASGVRHEIVGANLGQESAAQLRFAATGVDVVLFASPSGIQQLLFMQSAENQAYRPAYVLSDADSTRFVSENAATAQARNIRGFGTLPLANVPLQSYPTTPREQRCLDVIREGGEDNASRMTNLTATVFCEVVDVFEAVATAAGPELTHDALRAAYRGLGTAYAPVTTFQTDLSTGRNDNALLYRPFAWDDGCGCLAYTGDPRPVSR